MKVWTYNYKLSKQNIIKNLIKKAEILDIICDYIILNKI